jgi:uncharacterized protein (DUF305 family)
MKSKILWAFTLLTGALLFQACNSNDKKTSAADSTSNMMNSSGMMNMDHSMMQTMNSTLKNIKGMNPSGDFDCDYANMMILHHQSAIAASDLEMEKGADERMKMMAKNIKKEHSEEITKMHAILNNFKVIAPDNEPVKMHQELNESMQFMMDQMNGVKMTNNTDKNYAMMMISHHKSALKMAQYELKYGKQPELKKMAQHMVDTQENEIKQFEEMLSNQK